MSGQRNGIDLRRRLDRVLAERDHALRSADEERVALENAKADAVTAVVAQQVAQDVAAAQQTAANERIASVVSRCLEAVFGRAAHRFRIDFAKKRGRTEARLEFATADGTMTEPLEEADGGSVDVAALGLRLACLVLSMPRRRRLLCLDEPMRNVHGDGNRQRAAELLLTVAREMDVQIVMATGLEWLKVGKVIDLDGLGESG